MDESDRFDELDKFDQGALAHALDPAVPNGPGLSSDIPAVPPPSAGPESFDPIKRMPHSLEAEQATLGGVLLDPQAWDKVADKVVADDFYLKAHRFIFSRMQWLAGAGQPIDLTTLSQQLQLAEDSGLEGGNPYLSELIRHTPSAANVAVYAKMVRDCSVLRQLIRVTQEITAAAYRPEQRQVYELLDEAERKIFQIAHQVNRGQGPVEVSVLLKRAIVRVKELERLGSTITGLKTGFTDIDKCTSGLQKGDLIIVAGRPSMGKTTFAMNLAEGAIVARSHALAAAESGVEPDPQQSAALAPVLVFSMEMPGEMLALRLLSSLSAIPLSQLRTGALEPKDWDKLNGSIQMIQQSNMFIDDTGSLTPMEVRTRARRVVKEHGGISLIVLDYLQLMRVPGYKENRTQEISEISRSLKALARELAVPVIALSQLNRELEHRPNKRPVMSDLRESGAIEQDADLIAFIYRDEVYQPDSADKGIAEIIIAKHRNGPTGTVKLTFKREISRFEDFASPERFGELSRSAGHYPAVPEPMPT